MIIDPRCYRNRCSVWSLYWASQSQAPIIEECNITYTILELPTADVPITIDNTFDVDRTVLGTCDLIEQMQSTLFTFTDDGGGTLGAVEIVTVPKNGTLTVGTEVVKAGDIITTDDFTTGLYYNSDDLTNTAYSDNFLFRISTVETGLWSGVGTMAVNVTLCTNSGPVATDNTVPVDRTVTPSCLVSEEYTDGSIFTFTDAEGDPLDGVKIISLPENGILRRGQFDAVFVGEVLDFSEPIYYITDSDIDTAYQDTVQFQVRTDHYGAFSNTATLTFDVTLCGNTNELPVATDNSIDIDRLTAETCLLDVKMPSGVFTYTDTDEDPLNAVKIVTLPTTGTLTTLSGAVILAGQTLLVPGDFSIYYHTNNESQGSYVDDITFQVRTDENTGFSNAATLTINVSECTQTGTPCVDYEPYFDTSSGGIGLLSAGTLISDIVTVGDYVIEWRLGSATGTLKLVSGSTPAVTDTDVQVYHNPSNFPVPMEAGTYYPVIRWIEIDGVIYHSQAGQGDIYGTDLIDCVDLIDVLQPIEVENLNCSNGRTGTYSHTIEYSNQSNPPEAAALSTSFYLNEDGSTKYIGWEFTGKFIADLVSFYYVSGGTETLLEQVSVGYDVTTDLSGIGGAFSSYNFKSVVDLRNITYVLGDYIKIEILPSVSQPEVTNTDWVLKLICLGDIFNCNYINEDWRTIDPCTVVATYNEVDCRVEITFDTLATLDNTLPEFRYLRPMTYIAGDYSISTDNHGRIFHEFSRNTRITHLSLYGDCVAVEDLVTYTKTGNFLDISFTSATRYTQFKDRYYELEGLILEAGYVNDPTDINYYKWIEMFVRDVEDCGDAGTVYRAYWHYSSPIEFNDVGLNVRVTPIEVTNQIVDEVPCSDIYETLQSYLPRINSGYNLADGLQVTTNSLNGNLLGAKHITVVELSEEHVKQYVGLGFPVWNIDKVCGAPISNYHESSEHYIYYKYNIDSIITDTSDPTNNFELWDNMVNGVRSYDSADWTLIYKIENGVVTVGSCDPGTLPLETYCYRPAYVCGDSLHEISGHEPYTGSITYLDEYGVEHTNYYCRDVDNTVVSVQASAEPITVGMVFAECV